MGVILLISNENVRKKPNKTSFLLVIFCSNSSCPTIFMSTGVKVHFYRYFGVQIFSPALFYQIVWLHAKVVFVLEKPSNVHFLLIYIL